MRWSTLITLIISCLLLGTLAAPVSGPVRRDEIANGDGEQDAGPTTAESSGSETSVTATQTDVLVTATDASTTAQPTATGTHALTTGSLNATATTSTPSATSTVPSLDGTTSSSESDGSDSSRPTYTSGLPITPKITPAFGVGGFILMALGAVLAFIGVRKQWYAAWSERLIAFADLWMLNRVQIFLSTGFCTALGVTVLIIYVMSPPVSNAVQGGYLVAIFFTGAVFGGLSLVFREICEGLGCLLGGFCLSMWFLTLRPGGLLTESGPKAGMIIAFAVGFYSLCFSHYTRPYGLIGCTSFSGATALVLGIDCYSRAGLKEFWLYIWGLNNNVFPLRTDTYPVTRGIRVELAATIIVGILGVISQVRLWNVIKERRAKEEDIRKEHNRKIEEEDAEAGRRLEEKNIQERAEWELIYGNGKGADVKTASISETAVGDSRRGSDGYTSSDNEKGADIELKEVHSPDSSGSASGSEKNSTGENGTRELEAVPEESSQDQEHGPEHGPENEPKGHRPTTPVTHALGVARDDASENGAIVGSEVGTPRSKRFSGRDMANRASMLSQEAMVIHDDANSSVQGVADDLHGSSVGCPSVASDVQDPVQVTEREINASETSEKDIPAANVDAKSNVGSQAARDDTEAIEGKAVDGNAAKEVVSEEASANKNVAEQEPIKSTVATEGSGEDPSKTKATEQPISTAAPEQTSQPTDAQPEAVAAAIKTQEVKAERALQSSPPGDGNVETAKDVSESQPRTAATTKPEPTPEPVQEPVPEPIPEPVPEPKIEPPKVEPKVEVIKRLDANTIKALPQQTSRVIHSYRTNEWAKHLADADIPEWEPIEFDPDPETQESDEAHEAPAVVDVDGLLQTPLTAQPAPIVNRPEPPELEQQPYEYVSSTPGPEIPRSKTRTGAHGLTTKAMPPLVTRNEPAAAVPMMRSSSGPTSPVQEQGLKAMRNASTPLLTITTPNEPKETEPSPRWSGPPPLLAVREDMVRNRMSSTSNRFDPWSSRNQSRQSLHEIPNVASPISPISPISPLSVPQERDEDYTPHDEDNIPLSKRRALLQRQPMRSSSASLHSLEAASPIQSPPSPSGDLNRSASRMAAWRQSVREEITHKRDILQSPPISPVSPVDKRNTWGSVQQMREASSTQLGNAIAEGMQRGSMTDLHRQAMRRMQASANRKL
ncbi:unnamed protein product [Penicillium olsonii]|uniref:TM7S3/TM198-like domain-containing protein n=1 Tax=Penicillium olsonii TaxID=99116 RepID=A0A9W4HM21_PENOL|nr:unnamed protein product [Penicillium olsonii]